MKVLYVSASAQMGGAEVCLLDMMSTIREAHPQWQLAMVAPAPGPLAERAKALGAEVHLRPYPAVISRLGDSGVAQGCGASDDSRFGSRLRVVARLAVAAPSVKSYVRAMKNLMSEFSPHLVHANGIKANLLSSWACEGKIPLVWHLHDYLSARPLAARLARWTLRPRPHSPRRCAAIIANSHSVAADAQPFCEAVPIQVMHNAVDLDEFAPAGPRLDLDRLAGLPLAPAGTVRIGLVCTMAWWKGQKDFIRAIALLPLGLNVRGYVIGGPIYETQTRQFSVEELRRFAQELAAGDRIAFTGFATQPAAAMRALDIVVHASSQPEPFGRVIVEAMACGKPVITTGAGGAAELIHAGDDAEQNALTFTAGDPASLARRITELAGRGDLRDRLAQNGRAHATANFDRRRLSSELVSIYGQAMQRTKAAGAPEAAVAGQHA
jgi:glycosyltransferase involved in cell wall biosynthesis